MQNSPKPGDIIGYVGGKAVRLIAGGSEPAVEAPVVSNTAGGVLVGADPRPPQNQTFTLLPTATPSTQTAPAFTAEQIAKARQEEKDKLYPELQTMREQLAELKKERDDKLAAEKKARKEAEDAAKAALEADTDTRSLLEQKEAEWNARFEALQADRDERDPRQDGGDHEKRAGHDLGRACADHAAKEAGDQRAREGQEDDGLVHAMRSIQKSE